MVYPWAVMIGIGVGIAGLLFVLFQEERENRRRNTYGQRRIDSPGPSNYWDFPDDEPNPSTLNRRESNRSVGAGGNCAICLESIFPQDTAQVLKCSHRFHAACIMKWFQEDRSCPNCRIRA